MNVYGCRADPAAEYSRKLEYLKREEELIKEEELEAEAILQPSGQTLQVRQFGVESHTYEPELLQAAVCCGERSCTAAAGIAAPYTAALEAAMCLSNVPEFTIIQCVRASLGRAHCLCHNPPIS